MAVGGSGVVGKSGCDSSMFGPEKRESLQMKSGEEPIYSMSSSKFGYSGDGGQGWSSSKFILYFSPIYFSSKASVAACRKKTSINSSALCKPRVNSVMVS